MKPKRTIIIVDYDPSWAKTFLNLKEVLEKTLDNNCLGIEHIGSTSVPALAAKPIIDLDIIIDSLDLLPSVIKQLNTLGYFHQGDLGIKGREAFERLDNKVPYEASNCTWPNHHLYVCHKDSLELSRHIIFRNFLRLHPEYAIEYSNLKRRLAIEFFQDSESYTEAKTEFVENILKIAKM